MPRMNSVRKSSPSMLKRVAVRIGYFMKSKSANAAKASSSVNVLKVGVRLFRSSSADVGNMIPPNSVRW